MPIVRQATVDDIEALLRLRAVMFDAMEVDYKPAHWESACRQILLDGLSSGDLVAAVAESDDGRVVASGIGAIRRWLPSPRNPSGLRGYIGSVATDTDWRRQGVGRQVIESLIEMLQGRGVAASISMPPRTARACTAPSGSSTAAGQIFASAGAPISRSRQTSDAVQRFRRERPPER